MKTLCKQKCKKKKCKKRNQARFELIATHQCKKCDRLSCSKKALCKPRSVA